MWFRVCVCGWNAQLRRSHIYTEVTSMQSNLLIPILQRKDNIWLLVFQASCPPISKEKKTPIVKWIKRHRNVALRLQSIIFASDWNKGSEYTDLYGHWPIPQTLLATWSWLLFDPLRQNAWAVTKFLHWNAQTCCPPDSESTAKVLKAMRTLVIIIQEKIFTLLWTHYWSPNKSQYNK